jgi:RNA-directed DNA polymerase
VAKDTFGKVDHAIWEQLWQWACQRHPNKPLTWVKDRYFVRQGTRDWVFGTEVTDDDGTISFVKLVKASNVSIRRHRKIKAEANPFDPAWRSYFEERHEYQMQCQEQRLRPKLWQAQDGKCPVCREPVTRDVGWEIHHVVPRASGGTNARANLVLLHPNCHCQAHSSVWKGELLASIIRGFEEA